VLFTFPSRYLFTIGRRLVFSLTRWSAQIHAKLHLCRATQEIPQVDAGFRYRTVTFYGPVFQLVSLPCRLWLWTPITLLKNSSLGCSAFARHYLRNRFRFLLLWLMRCFTSPGFTCVRRADSTEDIVFLVTQFGDPRVVTYLPFSVAYRSLSRPSSSSDTKAFIINPNRLSSDS
jgi:hypothetical protein